MNVSDMTVTEEDGYLSRSKTFNSNNKIAKERIWIAVKLTILNRVAKVDVEPNARSRTYSKSSRLHVRMFKKSEHEQETSNESPMCDKWFAGVTRRIRRITRNAWWFDPCRLC